MNKIFLKGRLTKEPDLSVTSTGIEFLNFSVAVQRSYKNASGERDVDFINCIAWRKTATFVAEYFEKGQEIIVIGELNQDNWTADDGTQRTSYRVNVESVDFCGSKPNNSTNTATAGAEKPSEASRPEQEDLPFDDMPW